MFSREFIYEIVELGLAGDYFWGVIGDERVLDNFEGFAFGALRVERVCVVSCGVGLSLVFLAWESLVGTVSGCLFGLVVCKPPSWVLHTSSAVLLHYSLMADYLILIGYFMGETI